MLNCLSYLYILGTNPLLVISFTNIFSLSVCCFHSSDGLINCSSLMSCHLFIFVFVLFCFCFCFLCFCFLRRHIESKKRNIANIYVKESSKFSPRRFMICLMFRSLYHFDFIFVHDIGKYSNFMLSRVIIQFSQHHLLTRLSILHCIFSKSVS